MDAVAVTSKEGLVQAFVQAFLELFRLEGVVRWLDAADARLREHGPLTRPAVASQRAHEEAAR